MDLRKSGLVAARAAALAVALCGGGRAAAQAAPPPAAAPPAAAPAPPAPLSESLTGEAKAAYELAKALFASNDFASAMLKFRRAQDLSGDPRLFWNMAVCETKAHHYANVIRLLERYRREGSALLTEQDRERTDKLYAASRALVSAVEITVREAGAEVYVDDELVGTAPLAAPVLVDAGARRIRVSKPGFRDHAKIEQLEGGGAVALSVRLERDVHEGRLVVAAGGQASISLDGKVVGVGRWDGKVASGGHTLRVTAPGMLPYQSEVVVQDNELRRIEVDLHPPERAGGLPPWLWIVGGAVAAAGVVTAGVVLLQPDAAPPVNGTLGTVSRSSGARW